MKYKVVSEGWNLDLGREVLEDCVIFESNNLKTCKKYVKDHKLPQDRIVKENGRVAIGDCYGAYDNDLGWEYD